MYNEDITKQIARGILGGSMMKGLMNAGALAQMMRLKEMGARIQAVNSKMCYVKFEIEGIQIEYAYGVNTVGKYFLERIKPYTLPLREFAKEEKLMEIIEIDLEQFRMLASRSDLKEYIAVSNQYHHVFQRFEDLCLYFEVEDKALQGLRAVINEVDELITKTAEKSKRAYFRKDPDIL